MTDAGEEHRHHAHVITVVGERWAPETHEVKDFLARGRVAYRWYDPAVSREAAKLLASVPEAGARASAVDQFRRRLGKALGRGRRRIRSLQG